MYHNNKTVLGIDALVGATHLSIRTQACSYCENVTYDYFINTFLYLFKVYKLIKHQIQIIDKNLSKLKDKQINKKQTLCVLFMFHINFRCPTSATYISVRY